MIGRQFIFYPCKCYTYGKLCSYP